MADILNREKAVTLRKKGFSIGEIAKKLNKQKSTISYWCKNIPLSKAQIDRISNKSKTYGLKSILINSQRAREKRSENIKNYSELGKNDLNNISKRDLFILGLSLYWGEGYKKGNDEFGFTNSDPVIIKTIIKWLNEIYLIDNKEFILRVSINKIHKKREQEIIKYWSKNTNTKIKQFTKTSFIKSEAKKIYKDNKTYYGTLRIKVRNGANLRRRVMGSIEYMSKLI